MGARGAYNTKQKAQILLFLSGHKQRRLTVDEISQSMAQQGHGVGKTTIYRHLEALALQGAVLKYVSAEGVTCYQYFEGASGCEAHSHLVCTDCGELMHLDCELVRELDRHMMHEHGFALDNAKTVLYGRCAQCLELEKERR